MKLVTPPIEQRIFAARAMKTLALADGELHPKERQVLELASEAMSLEVDVEALETIEPEELAEGLTDVDSREALMQRLVVLSTLDAEVSDEEVSLMERYGAALGVEERAVHNMRQLVKGHFRRMAFDMGRRSFLPKKLKHLWSQEGLEGLWKIAKPLLGITDPELSDRFEALGDLPENTFGYGLYHQFVDNGFAYPGQKHGAPASLLFHDAGHVLSGYGTEPEGELKVAGFQAGYMGEDGLVMYLLIAMLFQLGIEPIAKLRGVPAHKGLLDIETFREAFMRGRAMNQSLVTWDPWDHMERPLDELREELGVPPLA